VDLTWDAVLGKKLELELEIELELELELEQLEIGTER
jgi:hypothetical protein